MSFGKWLRGATRVRLDSSTLANALRTGGMLGGAALGGPAGLALAAAGSAAGRGISKGANLGNILGAGATGAATAGALNSGAGLLKGALQKGATSAVPSAIPSAAAPSAAAPLPEISHFGIELPGAVEGAADAASAVAPTVAPVASHGALSQITGGLERVGKKAGSGALSFVHDNPTAAAMGLQAVGGLATAGAENRLHNAQADVIEQQAGESRYDFEKRKRREAQLAPVWSNLGTAIGGNFSSAARNPYAVA